MFAANSVTRFGDISPLWQNFKSLWQLWSGLFSVRQNFELIWQFNNAIGKIVSVANVLILNKLSRDLVTLAANEWATVSTNSSFFLSRRFNDKYISNLLKLQQKIYSKELKNNTKTVKIWSFEIFSDLFFSLKQRVALYWMQESQQGSMQSFMATLLTEIYPA